jgi:hypothetical protein
MKKINLKRSVSIIYPTLIVAALVLFALPMDVKANGTTTLSVIPSTNTFTTWTTPVNSTFVVNATVTDVTDLWNWQVMVLFNKGMLACVTASVPEDSPFKFTVTPKPVIDNITGYVKVGSGNNFGEPGVNGSGVLASMTFKIISAPTTPGESLSCGINFSRPYGNEGDTYLYTEEGLGWDPIPATLQDGTFEYSWPLVNMLTHEIVVNEQTYTIVTESNCTLNPVPMDFDLDEQALYFNISGTAENVGYVNVTIPKDFMWGSFNVTVNGEQKDAQTSADSTHTFIYFTFNFTGADQPVAITAESVVPEFPSSLILLTMFLITTLAAAAILASRKKTPLKV